MNLYPSECPEDADNNVVLNPPEQTLNNCWPTHLTCPYCPAQAYPQESWAEGIDCVMRLYVCPARHKFYVEGEPCLQRTATEPAE